MRYDLLPLCCVFLVACWQAAPLPVAGTPQSDVAQGLAAADAGTDAAAPSIDADEATAADTTLADAGESGEVADVLQVPDGQPDLWADATAEDGPASDVATKPDNGPTGATDAGGPDGGAGDGGGQADTGPDCPMGNIGGGGMTSSILCNDTECCLAGSTLGPCGWHHCCAEPGSPEVASIGLCPIPLPAAQPPWMSLAPCTFLYEKYVKNGSWLPACKAECWCE